MNKARQALYKAFFAAVAKDKFKRNNKPGEVIEALSTDTREDLKSLKAEDIASPMRHEIEDDEETQARKKLSKLLLEFDKKILSFISSK